MEDEFEDELYEELEDEIFQIDIPVILALQLVGILVHLKKNYKKEEDSFSKKTSLEVIDFIIAEFNAEYDEDDLELLLKILQIKEKKYTDLRNYLDNKN
tara:strand:+ start:12920 stop:13216 length:297 start_codon:yes stop_codon:yes gene_type:complete